MNIARLIALLEYRRRQYGDDMEVKILSVLPAPVEGGIEGVITGGEINRLEDEDAVQVVDSRDHVLYIVGGCLDGTCDQSVLAEVSD